jgi:WD40 repeat protein
VTARLRFQAGGTLAEGSIYVKRRADSELPEALSKGEFCSVLSTRQIGKSSLRQRAARALAGAGAACVTIDLTALGTDDSKPENWYLGLASEIAEQLELDTPDAFWKAHQGFGPVHCWSRYLEDEVLARVDRSVVIFVDEIDATLSLPFSRDDFFAAIRALYNRRVDRPANRRLTFCLLGVAAPGDLISDPTRTPFNVGRAIRLEDFTWEEMAAFRAGFEGVRDGGDALLREIYGWTSGHPYMTQRLCEDLATEARDRTVDQAVRARFLDRGRTDDPNLRYADRCFKDARAPQKIDPQMPRMLRLYRRLLGDELIPADFSDPVQLALMLTGLAAETTEAGGSPELKVRNRIFRTVFDLTWVRAREADRAIADPLARWLESGRKEDFLLRGEALREVLIWAEGREDTTGEEQAFLQACARAEDRRHLYQRFVVGLVVVSALLFVALVVAVWQGVAAANARQVALEQAENAREAAAKAREAGDLANREAAHAKRESSEREAATKKAEEESARAKEAAAKADFEAAAKEVALEKAERASQLSEARRLAAIADLAGGAAIQRRWLLAVEAVTSAAATGEGMVSAAEQALGDAVRGAVDQQPLVGHTGAVVRAAWNADGSRVLSASMDSTARIFSADGSAAPIVLRGHTEPVVSAAWSPDHARVLTASWDRTARIFRADGQGDPIVLRGHVDRLAGAAWSPDGSRVVTYAWDRTARVFRADGQGDPVVLTGHTDKLTGAAFTPDGKRVATSSLDATTRVWRTDAAGPPLLVLKQDSPAHSVALSPDGARLVTTSADAVARVFRADELAPPILLRGHKERLTSAAFTRDGSRVVTTSWDGSARVFRADGRGDPVVLQGHQNWVLDAAVSPDGSRVATASVDGTARIWSIDGDERPVVLRGHALDVNAASWSPDGARLATASNDGQVRVWKADGRSEPVVLRDPDDSITAAALSPDGELVATGSENGVVRVRRADGAGRPVTMRDRHVFRVNAVSFAPDGKRFVTASSDRTARVYSVDGEGEPITLRGHISDVDSAVFSRDGAFIVTASSDNTARVYRADGQGDPVELSGHQSDVNTAAFSPDGQRVVTASSDDTAWVWALRGGAKPVALSGHISEVIAAAFSPDGARVFTFGDTTLRIWPASGAAAFSPDRTRLVAVSKQDNTARVWRADRRSEPILLRGHLLQVTSASWSADGARVITSSEDRTARIWTLSIEALKRVACAYAGRNLSRDEWDQYMIGIPYRKTCGEWPESLPPKERARTR